MARAGSSGSKLAITDELVQVLHEVMPIGDGARPDTVSAWMRGQHFRKIVARYPNGWQLNVNFGKQGKVTSASSSYTVKLEACPKSSAVAQ